MFNHEEEDPDDNYIINLSKNIQYSKNEMKIKYKLSLKYYEFNKISNLTLNKFTLKKMEIKFYLILKMKMKK